jgi:hypothetical protein
MAPPKAVLLVERKRSGRRCSVLIQVVPSKSLLLMREPCGSARGGDATALAGRRTRLRDGLTEEVRVFDEDLWNSDEYADIVERSAVKFRMARKSSPPLPLREQQAMFEVEMRKEFERRAAAGAQGAASRPEMG